MDAPPLRSGLLAALKATTFRSLRHRDYRLYFVGQAVSFTGSWVQSAALLWSVYALTKDPVWPPLMLVGGFGPTLLFGPLGGMVADRVPKKPLIQACQAAFLLSAAALTVLVWFGMAHPLVAFALAVFNGVVQAVDLPGRLAYVPELVPKEDLVNAVGLNSLLFNLGRATGPAVAGLVFLVTKVVLGPGTPDAELTRVGATACFALNALSFAAVILALSLIRHTPPAAHTVKGKLADGFAFVGRNPRLAALLGVTFLLSLFAWPLPALFPPIVDKVLGHDAAEYSWLVSAVGAGALVAAVANATFGNLTRARVFLLFGAVMSAGGVVGVALSTSLVMALTSAAWFGFGMILFLSTGQSVLQLSTPDHFRGRVMVLWPMTLSAGAIAGNLLSGWAAKRWESEGWPLSSLLWVMAAGTGLTAVAAAALAWRLRRPSPPLPAGERSPGERSEPGG
jgi:MFS family permease